MQPNNLIVTKTSKGYLQLTYAEHQVKAKMLASALTKYGIKLGDRVASLMWNCANHLTCYHGVSCMGAVLHTLNLRLGEKDLGIIIEHAQDRMIISDADVLPLLGAVDPAILNRVEHFVCNGLDWEEGNYKLPASIPASKTTSWEKFLATGSPDYVWPEFPETTFHALCYTSGTTGMPKGAAYSHRSTYLHTLASGGADNLGLSGADVVLPVVPMFHVLAWGVPFVTTMLGTRMIFNGKYMDPDSLLDCFMDWKVTFSNGVPTVWQGVQGIIEKRGIDKVKAQLALNTLTCGGSAPASAMMKWYADKLGVQMVQGWGMTETNPLALIARQTAKFKDIALSSEAKLKNCTKAGLSIPGLTFRIADPDNLDKDMPRGESGELLVKGPWIISEYFQFDAPDKFHKGFLVTGDVAKYDEEGAVIITDRSKDVIKSGGEWISSIDMENHIVAMDEVAAATVVAVPHPKWDERPVAIVVLKPGADQKDIDAKVIEHCTKLFAKFQLPDDVLVWKELPLTSTGKLDKKVMRQKLADAKYVLPSLRKEAKSKL